MLGHYITGHNPVKRLLILDVEHLCSLMDCEICDIDYMPAFFNDIPHMLLWDRNSVIKNCLFNPITQLPGANMLISLEDFKLLCF